MGRAERLPDPDSHRRRCVWGRDRWPERQQRLQLPHQTPYKGPAPAWMLLGISLTGLSAIRSGSRSRKLMTGIPRKKGHPTSEALDPGEVESEGVVKVSRAGGTV